MRAPLWSDQEIRFLRDNYEQMMDKEVSHEIGRTAEAIQSKRSQLGLRKVYRGVEPSYELNLSETEKAYLAGLLDGDGSIFLSEYHYPNKKGVKGIHSVISFAVSISSANKEFVEEIKKMIGGISKRRSKSHYEVRLGRQSDILQFLEALVPYLRLKKKEAEIMIPFCRNRLNARKKRYNTPVDKEARLLMKEMKELNNTPMGERDWR